MSHNSPVPPKQGNLTGIPRKLKDSCADLHNYIQNWNKITIKGVVILRKIAVVRLQVIATKQSETPGSGNEYPQEILPLNEKLTEICEELTKIVSKMQTLTIQLSKVPELREAKQMSDPPFQIWPINKFHSVAKTITSCYEKELAVKKDIITDFTHQTCNNSFTFLTSLWSHQVYIPTTVSLLLESALMETGYRQAV